MITQTMSRGEQSRAHIRCLSAFGCTLELPANRPEAATAALVEAMVFYSNGTRLALSELFLLAEKVLSYRDQLCGVDDTAIYDLPSLVRIVGNAELARLAVRLCGAFCLNGTWRDGDDDGTLIVFPEDFDWRSIDTVNLTCSERDLRLRNL